MAQKQKWTQVGTIRMSEKGKLYIKFHGQTEDGNYTTKCLNELADRLVEAGNDGLALQIEKPVDKIMRLHELGFIDESKLQGRIDAVPPYIKYEISLPLKLEKD